MLTRQRIAQPEAALKANTMQQPTTQRMTRSALGARDTNLLVELAAPLSIGGSGALLKQTAIPSRASSRSSKLAKLSSRVANLVAIVAAESEAAKENPAAPRSLTQELEDAQSQQQQQEKEDAAANEEEEGETEDANDRAWIEMNKQVTPMKKRERQSMRKSVAATTSSSARKSLAPSAASSHSQYTELHTSVLNDVAPTPFASTAAASRKSLSLTPTPASTSTAARRRRRSSTKGAALKFASTVDDDGSLALNQAAADEFAPVSLTTQGTEAEEFGASIPDEPSISSESEAEAPAFAARAMPTTCFTPTRYERRTRKSTAAATARSPHNKAFANTRKSDRRSLHHTQLQLLKQLVAEDEQAELQMEQQQEQEQQQRQEEESVAVAVEAAIEPVIHPTVESAIEPVAEPVAPSIAAAPTASTPTEPQAQSVPSAEASVAEAFEIRPITAVIPAPAATVASSAVVEPQAEIEPSSLATAVVGKNAVSGVAAVRVSPKRFAASARKARSLAPTTPSASAAAAGPTRRAHATAARKSLFDASMRDEAAAASLFSSGLMRLTFHAGTPPATPAGLIKPLQTSPESAHKRKSARNSIAQEPEPAAETVESTPSTLQLLSTPRVQITGRSPARRRSLQTREQETETEPEAEPVAVETALDAVVMEQTEEPAEAEQLVVPAPIDAALQEQEADAADAEQQQQEQVDAPQQPTPVHSRRSTPMKQNAPAAASAVAATPRRSPLRSVTKQQAAASKITTTPQEPVAASPIRSSPVRSARSSAVHVAAATPYDSSPVELRAAVVPQSPQQMPSLASVESSAEPSPIKQSVEARVSPKRFAASARKARSLAPTTPSASAAAGGPSRRAPATAARKSLFDASMRDEAAAASLFSSGLMRLTFHAGTPPATPAGLIKPLQTSPESAHKRKSARNSIAQEPELAAETVVSTPQLQSPARDQITGRSPARRRSLQVREQQVEAEPEAEPKTAIVEDVPVESEAEPVVSAVSPMGSPLHFAAKQSPAAPVTPVRSPVRSSPRSPVRAAAVAATAATPAAAPTVSPAQQPQLLSPDAIVVSPSKHSRKSLLKVVTTRFARRGAPQQAQEIPDAILQRLFTATKESVSPVQLSPDSRTRSRASGSADSSWEVSPEKQAVRVVRSPQKKHMNTPVPVAAAATPLPVSPVPVASPPLSPVQAAAASTPSPPQKAVSRRRSKRSPGPVVSNVADIVGSAAAVVTVPSKTAAEVEAIAMEPEQPSVPSFVRSHPIQCAAVVVSFMGAAAGLCYFI